MSNSDSKVQLKFIRNQKNWFFWLEELKGMTYLRAVLNINDSNDYTQIASLDLGELKITNFTAEVKQENSR